MAYKLNGALLPMDTAFTDSNGSQYPSTWLRNSTQAQRDAVPTGGITWQVEPAWDQEFYTGASQPRDLAACKTRQVEKQKKAARSFLADTDWLVSRKSEKGTAIPSDVQTYRDNVRTQCTAREATINACSDVDTLLGTMRGTLSPTIAGTGSNGATEKKQDDGSSFDPIQYNDIANPGLLEKWPDPLS